ncbi:HEAT repeat domain-containing protein [Streptomyces sp. NPDC091271]|uniref:HEAT repeat domain-containing protein n=1 Tax=Streptomyces sp. NPDC091271 TaxID=3365980 RepID=UPI00381B8B33
MRLWQERPGEQKHGYGCRQGHGCGRCGGSRVPADSRGPGRRHHGADPRPSAPGSLLPLCEAVDSGAPALVRALLDDRILARYAESELLDARDLARDWCETGVEAGLRRRTGSEDVVTRTRVQDDEYNRVDEFTLDGMTVRDGHGAVLTRLEELLGARTSFEELMARATVHADQGHAPWAAATMLLAHRRDRATWTAAAALRTHTESLHRLFGAEVPRLTHLFDGSDEDAFACPALDTFTGWSAEETDPAVLAEVLVALGEHSGPRAEAALLPHAGHHETRVRRAVARGLGAWPSPPAFSGAVRTALRELMRDPEAGVRQDACLTFTDGKDHDPALIEAMAALMDDEDRGTTAESPSTHRRRSGARKRMERSSGVCRTEASRQPADSPACGLSAPAPTRMNSTMPRITR